MTVITYYTCRKCDVQGRDPEVAEKVVLCWSCGEPAEIISRLVKDDG